MHFGFVLSFCSRPDGDEAGAASVASGSSSKGKSQLIESLGEDGNLNISNVTNAVVGKVGNLLGKGMGLGSKLGGGGWF